MSPLTRTATHACLCWLLIHFLPKEKRERQPVAAMITTSNLTLYHHHTAVWDSDMGIKYKLDTVHCI